MTWHSFLRSRASLRRLSSWRATQTVLAWSARCAAFARHRLLCHPDDVLFAFDGGRVREQCYACGWATPGWEMPNWNGKREAR